MSENSGWHEAGRTGTRTAEQAANAGQYGSYRAGQWHSDAHCGTNKTGMFPGNEIIHSDSQHSNAKSIGNSLSILNAYEIISIFVVAAESFCFICYMSFMAIKSNNSNDGILYLISPIIILVAVTLI